MSVVCDDGESQADVLTLTGYTPLHSTPVSVSEERRGLGGPHSGQAGATLRPVTVCVRPPHLSRTLSRDQYTISVMECLQDILPLLFLQPCVLILNIDTLILPLCCNTLLLLYIAIVQLTSTP